MTDALGENTVGDPDAMRALAALWRAHATLLEETIQRIQAFSQNMEFQGPASDRFREHLAGDEGAGRLIAQRLEELSTLLVRDADMVESLQRVSNPLRP